MNKLFRPPLGFVVEGHGEYNCYPSLVYRIIGESGFKVPLVNAGGYGGIYKNLRKYLTNLVFTEHPHNVIVTVDYLDLESKGFVSNCSQLIAQLTSQVSNWLENDAITDSRLVPLPDRIAVILQIQQFETWFLADVLGLVKNGHVKETFNNDKVPDLFLYNVDEKILNPASWLYVKKTSAKDLKNPKYARILVQSVNPSVMKENSRSFRKFHKEVFLSYQQWCKTNGFICDPIPN